MKYGEISQRYKGGGTRVEMTVAWGIAIFVAGVLVGMFVMGVIAGTNTADQRIWELRRTMVLRIEQWLQSYNESHTSAFERMVAKEVVNMAINVIKTTEAD